MTDYPFEWMRPPVWTEADGDVRNVWRNKPAGHRALWSCVWRTRLNLGYELDDMTIPELASELFDVAARGSKVASAVAMEVSIDPADRCWSRYKRDVLQILHDARPTYPDYTIPWALEPRAVRLEWRPGYEVVLPDGQFFAKRRDGTWVVRRDPNNIHETGIPVGDPAPMKFPVSQAHTRIAVEAKVQADIAAVQKSRRR